MILTQTNPAEANPVRLVETTRGALVESVHYGSLVVTDADGQVKHSAGVPGQPTYARSSLKPLQLIAMVRAGLDLPGPLLCLATASHSGGREHRDGAEQILALYGLDQTVLRNVPDLPYGAAEREEWLRSGHRASRLAQNCPGKHAAMAATCAINGWTLDNYLDPQHPLQRLIESTIVELVGENTAATTTDGCGSPVFAYSLHAVARAYGRLAAASDETIEGRVADSIRRHPEMVAGEGRDVVRLMRAVPGLIAKEGAEAVQLVGLSDGTGIAIKISDGGDRARMPATVAILQALGVEPGRLEALSTPVVLGGGQPVGALRPARDLIDALAQASITTGQR
jgi:L-asparaginase II